MGDGLAAMDALWHARRQRPAVRAGAARRPHARHGRPGAGRQDPGAGRAGRHAHHPADLRGAARRPGPVPRAADRRPPAQAGPAGRAARDDLPGDEPGRRRRPAGGRPVGRRNRPRRRSRPRRRCASWWPRTTSSTRSSWSSCSSRRGHRVRLASNGREALALAERGRLRPAAPGRPHAGAGRLPGRPGDPGAGADRGGPPARHRLDGALAERGPRALPRGRHGRLPDQADPPRRPVRRHRPGDPGQPGDGPGRDRCNAVGPSGGVRERPRVTGAALPLVPGAGAGAPDGARRRPRGRGRRSAAGGGPQAERDARHVLDAGRGPRVGDRGPGGRRENSPPRRSWPPGSKPSPQR